MSRRLRSERTRYAKECAAREAAVAEQNKAIDTLIADLGYGAVHAVQEYVSMSFQFRVPSHFPVEHDFEFDPATAELRLRVLVPGPDKVPTTGAYKYAKSADEITGTSFRRRPARTATRMRSSRSRSAPSMRCSRPTARDSSRRSRCRWDATIDPATGREVSSRSWRRRRARGVPRVGPCERRACRDPRPSRGGRFQEPLRPRAVEASGIRRS